MCHYTALANAKVLAYPYHSRTESQRVTLHEDVGMEQGFDLMDDGDWAGAGEHFQRIVEEEAHRIGEMTSYKSKERQRKAAALVNKGLVAEFQGRDDEAFELFERGLNISGGIGARRAAIGEVKVGSATTLKASSGYDRRQGSDHSLVGAYRWHIEAGTHALETVAGIKLGH